MRTSRRYHRTGPDAAIGASDIALIVVRSQRSLKRWRRKIQLQLRGRLQRTAGVGHACIGRRPARELRKRDFLKGSPAAAAMVTARLDRSPLAPVDAAAPSTAP